MAGSRILSRLSSTRLPSLFLKIRSNKYVIPTVSPLKSSSHPQVSSSVKLNSRRDLCKLPVELSCLISMMPLHSTIASARLTSLISIHSQSWALVPQGISMPL